MTELAQYERSVYSQKGEDGVLEHIFSIVLPGPKFAVDIGAADGVRGSNTRNLVVNHGWAALLIERDEALSRRSAQAASSYPQVTAINACVDRAIEALLRAHGVPRDLDLLSIDIDGNDYYVWEAIQDFRPKVVVIEYNAGFPPPQRAVVAYDPQARWDGSDYFGASIQSLCDLGLQKGYELAHVESCGANLFFVEAEVFPLLGIGTNSPEHLYRPPAYGLSYGGRAPNGRGYLCSNNNFLDS